MYYRYMQTMTESATSDSTSHIPSVVSLLARFALSLQATCGNQLWCYHTIPCAPHVLQNTYMSTIIPGKQHLAA